MLATSMLLMAGFVVVFDNNEDGFVRSMNIKFKNTRQQRNKEGAEKSGPPTTDFFVMLPGKEMDPRNHNLFENTRSSVLKFYNESYLHVVHNLADPSYLRRFPNESQRKDHITQNNNFALGAFTTAAGWMEENRPAGNFVMLQHSVSLIAKAAPPACDIELVNLRQRCGSPCGNPAMDNMKMFTGLGTSTCFPILNEMMGVYKTTCTFPCCPFDNPGDVHLDYWPLMAHNAVLFTSRARKFLKPLVEYVSSLPPGHVKKNGDEGTERLFGLFSSMLLREYGPADDRNFTVRGKYYSNAVEAYYDKVFLCSQDLTIKSHGMVPGRKRL